MYGELVISEPEGMLEPFEKRWFKDAAGSIEGVASQPDEFGFRKAEFSSLFELLAKLADINKIRKAQFWSPVAEGKGGSGLRKVLPDELEHEQFVEVCIQKRSSDRVEFPVMAVSATREIDDHEEFTLAHSNEIWPSPARDADYLCAAERQCDVHCRQWHEGRLRPGMSLGQRNKSARRLRAAFTTPSLSL